MSNIYELKNIDEPICQGDIFLGLPRVDLALEKMVFVDGGSMAGITQASWKDMTQEKPGPFRIMAPIRPVASIVVTQDCDAQHSQDITLCEIRRFPDVERKSKDTQSPKSWMSILTQHARINQKWFYLPPSEDMGFSEKMAADFTVTMRLLLKDVESLKTLRRDCLNGVAREHFRERIGEFFRRYPYDEWYALDENELQEYLKRHPDIEPYPWQKVVD